MRLHPAAALAVLALTLAAPARALPSRSLGLDPSDLRIEQRDDGGYHLYVRAKPGLGSILLTESTVDPEGKLDTYAYRALEDNPVNDGERRILSGKSIPGTSELHFLVDSSPERDPVFGRATVG